MLGLVIAGARAVFGFVTSRTDVFKFAAAHLAIGLYLNAGCESLATSRAISRCFREIWLYRKRLVAMLA